MHDTKHAINSFKLQYALHNLSCIANECFWYTYIKKNNLVGCLILKMSRFSFFLVPFKRISHIHFPASYYSKKKIRNVEHQSYNENMGYDPQHCNYLVC